MGAASSEAAVPEHQVGWERLRVGYQDEWRARRDAAGTGGTIHCTGDISYIHILGGIILMVSVCDHGRGRRMGNQYNTIQTLQTLQFLRFR
jgi:hypothetical protein